MEVLVIKWVERRKKENGKVEVGGRGDALSKVGEAPKGGGETMPWGERWAAELGAESGGTLDGGGGRGG